MRRLNDYKRLVMAISTNDVKQVQQIVRLALRQRVGVNEIIDRIGKAAKGVYHARRGYTAFDFDLALLMKRLAGRKGLYALSHAIGLPSMTTVRRRTKPPVVLPSSGFPRAIDVGRNITAFFGPQSENAKLPRCGYSLMLDGIHLSQRPRWSKSTCQIIGFCRDHEHGLDLSMPDMESVEKIAEAVHGEDPTCHFAKEATVAVFGAFRGEHYHPFPAMVSGTCKAEKGDGFANILRLCLSEWEKNGEKWAGPLWCVSTDGDATFRMGSHQVLMTDELDNSDPLYDLLAGLEGLNLQVGLKGIIQGPDIKHLIKREFKFGYTKL